MLIPQFLCHFMGKYVLMVRRVGFKFFQVTFGVHV